MKKITLFAFALLAMSSSKAQNNMALSGQVLTNKKTAQAPTVTNQRLSAPNIVPSTMATIFSEDFAGGFPAASNPRRR